MIIFETVWHLWKFTLKFSAPCVSDLFPRHRSLVGRKKYSIKKCHWKRGIHLSSSVLHTGLICAWFQTNTGSYSALTQGLHSPNHELFIRRKSCKCLTVSATAYQILYLEEQVEYHSPRLTGSLNNTKLLSFSVARRRWGRVLHLISAQWRLTKSLCACMDPCRRPGTDQQWLWSQIIIFTYLEEKKSSGAVLWWCKVMNGYLPCILQIAHWAWWRRTLVRSSTNNTKHSHHTLRNLPQSCWTYFSEGEGSMQSIGRKKQNRERNA